MKSEYERVPLTRDALARACGDAVSVCVFDSVDSTSNEAKRRVAAGNRAPLLIAASTQTAGRGRMGRAFYSPAESGVYFTLLYPTREPLGSAVSVTGAAAVAVMRAVKALTGKQTEIKWVNDLYFADKKICGILCEAIAGADEVNHLLVGIGINLYRASFPPELQDVAGSLDAQDVSRADMIARVVAELMPFLTDPHNRDWLSDYRAHSLVIGREITWIANAEEQRGRAIGINGDGELEVLSADGILSVLRTGEISVRL